MCVILKILLNNIFTEEDIEMLQEGSVIMKRRTNSGGQLPFDSDWPLHQVPQTQGVGFFLITLPPFVWTGL